MYFFKVVISSFDNEDKTLFIVPEQTADENGVPFTEKLVTQTAEYKAFVKETRTEIVDCAYTQYKTDAPLTDGVTEELFEQLMSEGKLTPMDSNTYIITTGKSTKKGGKGKLDMKTILIIGGAAVVLIALLIFSSVSGGDKSNETSGSSETVETTETAESAETETPATETTATSKTPAPETAETTAEEYVD